MKANTIKTRRRDRIISALTFKTVNLYGLYVKTKNTVDIDLKTFKAILEDFNIGMLNLAIEGVDFNLGHGLGILNVAKIKRKRYVDEEGNAKLTVAWNRSMIRKREIMAAGGTPFKSFRDENRKVIGDNGGEKWYQYYTDPWYMRWFWSKITFIPKDATSKKKFLVSPNLKFYNFIPCVAMRSLIAKITQENKDLKIKEYYLTY